MCDRPQTRAGSYQAQPLGSETGIFIDLTYSRTRTMCVLIGCLPKTASVEGVLDLHGTLDLNGTSLRGKALWCEGYQCFGHQLRGVGKRTMGVGMGWGECRGVVRWLQTHFPPFYSCLPPSCNQRTASLLPCSLALLSYRLSGRRTKKKPKRPVKRLL